MALREYVFKTSSASNLLCRWTREDARRWITIQLLRNRGRGKAEGAIFTIRADAPETDRLLKEEFAKRYGSYDLLRRVEDLTSVEVTNYLLPAYRGADPVELATNLLGPDAFFAPILVHDGFIHVRVYATPPADGRSLAELLQRITKAARPDEFELIHSGDWDPVAELGSQAVRLTERQQQVLKIAIDFGYYDDPRRCTLEEVARAFGVSKAAVHKHLLSAESKIMKAHRA